MYHKESLTYSEATSQASQVDLTLLRRKTQMVIYDIERKLGEFVTEQADADKKATTKKEVAESYLVSLLKMANDAVKGKSQEQYLKRLTQLFEILDVAQIRNAIAHPNRDFHPCYWYRIATIATDPLISQLNFLAVFQSWQDAEAGILRTPPEEWINKPFWSLPNNLPEQFDHDFTGLIGRKKDFKELRKLILGRSQSIGIVAPGGLGKTALLLEVLKDIVQTPDSAQSIDRVLFFSSKTEELTLTGIIPKVSSARTIEELKMSISQALSGNPDEISNFGEICQKFDLEKILLCFDNLETLLIEEPDAFVNFSDILPPSWRVVVTSRIRPDVARIMSLDPLDEDGSRKLAREYLSKRGADTLRDEEINNIVQSCKQIPLAIRLTIDGFIVGNKDLSQCISTATDRILEFSYQNLIEALSPVAQELLECFFANSKAISQREAISILEVSEDVVGEAFTQLRRTSLVTKSKNQAEESYTLSESVRELLLLNPLNPSTRSRVQEKLRTRRQKLTEIENLRRNQEESPLSNAYIPESAPDHVKVIVADACRELFRKSKDRKNLHDILKQVQQAIKGYPNDAVLYRLLGMILLELGDPVEGTRNLQKAWEMDPRDIAAGLQLSKALCQDNQFAEAKPVAQILVDLGWDDPNNSNTQLASYVVSNYCKSLISLGETEQVIEYTKNWENQSKNMRGSYGLMRVKALRESGQYVPNAQKIRLLGDAIDVLNQIFQSSEGYGGSYVSEGMKLVKELAISSKNYPKLSKVAKLKFTEFVDAHLVNMCQVHDRFQLDDDQVKTWVKTLSELSIEDGDNPLKSERWEKLLAEAVEERMDSSAAMDEKWLITKVYYIPNPAANGNRKKYLFVEDSTKQQYVVQLDKCNQSLKQDWENIKPYDKIEIVPDIAEEDGKAMKVKKARWYKG